MDKAKLPMLIKFQKIHLRGFSIKLITMKAELRRPTLISEIGTPINITTSAINKFVVK